MLFILVYFLIDKLSQTIKKQIRLFVCLHSIKKCLMWMKFDVPLLYYSLSGINKILHKFWRSFNINYKKKTCLTSVSLFLLRFFNMWMCFQLLKTNRKLSEENFAVSLSAPAKNHTLNGIIKWWHGIILLELINIIQNIQKSIFFDKHLFR